VRQAYHSTGYKAGDLTECKVHRLVDKETGEARFVLCYPKAWERDESVTFDGVNGKMQGRMYFITEWEEVPIELLPKGIWPSNYQEGDDKAEGEIKLRVG
jgi:hypothetical protein